MNAHIDKVENQLRAEINKVSNDLMHSLENESALRSKYSLAQGFEVWVSGFGCRVRVLAKHPCTKASCLTRERC